ncbi:MAG: (d)CMP kinase [Desulfobacterales bacterium]|nr:(d)CMP kinase [Desulfobacterales bacterium]
MKPLTITIDGPAGSGKTTVSKLLADRLGYRYIDTGALYRAVALEAKSAGLAPDDDGGLKELCGRMRVQFVQGSHGLRLLSNGTDLTDSIRTPEISLLASAVSARPVVRQYLLDIQRDMGRQGGAVFEGRDMGTVVFPDADVKFFLDASAKVRVLRRYDEMASTSSQSCAEVERDMKLRDKNDSTRELAPLMPARDAIRIDSSDLTIDQVVQLMLRHVDVA